MGKGKIVVSNRFNWEMGKGCPPFPFHLYLLALSPTDNGGIYEQNVNNIKRALTSALFWFIIASSDYPKAIWGKTQILYNTEDKKMANCLTCKFFVECEQVFAYINDDKECEFENEEETENAKECEIC